MPFPAAQHQLRSLSTLNHVISLIDIEHITEDNGGYRDLGLRSRRPRFKSANLTGAFLFVLPFCLGLPFRHEIRQPKQKNLPLVQCEGHLKLRFPPTCPRRSNGDTKSDCIFWLPDHPTFHTFPLPFLEQWFPVEFVPGHSCGAATASHRLPQKDFLVNRL